MKISRNVTPFEENWGQSRALTQLNLLASTVLTSAPTPTLNQSYFSSSGDFILDFDSQNPKFYLRNQIFNFFFILSKHLKIYLLLFYLIFRFFVVFLYFIILFDWFYHFLYFVFLLFLKSKFVTIEMKGGFDCCLYINIFQIILLRSLYN